MVIDSSGFSKLKLRQIESGLKSFVSEVSEQLSKEPDDDDNGNRYARLQAPAKCILDRLRADFYSQDLVSNCLLGSSAPMVLPLLHHIRDSNRAIVTGQRSCHANGAYNSVFCRKSHCTGVLVLLSFACRACETCTQIVSIGRLETLPMNQGAHLGPQAMCRRCQLAAIRTMRNVQTLGISNQWWQARLQTSATENLFGSATDPPLTKQHSNVF